jgi:hypothetical protein
MHALLLVCNEISLNIYLILDVTFMLPNVNLAIMDNVTIILTLLQNYHHGKLSV